MTREDIERGVRLMGEFPLCIACFDEQPEPMCLAAVKADPGALQFVREQTPEVVREALDRDAAALRFVHDQDFETCLYAIARNPQAMRYVEDQTEELCVAAIRRDPGVWEHIVDPGPEACRALVSKIGPEAAERKFGESHVDEEIISQLAAPPALGCRS